MASVVVPIAENLQNLMAKIREMATTAGRDADAVNLLAVSKTFGIDAINVASSAGQIHFGENYLQEAVDKTEARPDLAWHFIGAIQSNKTRQIAQHFDWVHTLASEKVARRLHDQRDPDKGPIHTFVQVNISGEASKAGVAPAEVSKLIETCLAYDRLDLVGLMAIPERTDDVGEQRRIFHAMQTLRQEIQYQYSLAGFTELSMGMSHDFEAAIREGATWIRIGTGIFGERAPKTT